MNYIKKNISTALIIIGIFILSVVISNKFDYSNSAIIEYTYVANAILTLFSVLLAIVALIITLLEKYKEKNNSSKDWALSNSNILKELSENTIFLLILYILIICCSIFESVLLLEKINIPEIILIFSLCIAIIITLDTAISIYLLVKGLKDILSKDNTEDLTLSQTEKYLIEAYRFLDSENKSVVNTLIKSIATNQQVEK